VKTSIQQGFELHQRGNYPEAQLIYEQILKLHPQHFDALWLIGTLYGQLQKYPTSVEFLTKALNINSEHATAQNNLGNAFNELGKLNEAIVCYEHALRIKPNYSQAYFNQGNVFIKLQRSEEAINSYKKSINYDPEFSDSYNSLGMALQGLKRFKEAIIYYDKAILLNPALAEAFNNRGVALQELDRSEDALMNFDCSINIKPDFVEAFNNRGLALYELKRIEEAILSYEKAISINPKFAKAYNNLGVALQASKRLDQAFAQYKKAIQLDPSYVEANWNLAVIDLLNGNFNEGWQKYEWRWKRDSAITAKRNFSKPLWLGETSLIGKSILLYAEQGLGDIIQFCRYIPMVSKLGATIILEIQPPLIPLLKHLKGANHIIALGHKLPNFDYQCPILSLPLAFKTNEDTIPPTDLSITSDYEKVDHWRQKLGLQKCPRIGLAWSSLSSFKDDNLRSLTLFELLQALPKEGFEYICLQKEIKDVDKKTLASNPQIQFFGSQLKDFSDTAALIECVDLVISTCTSVPHLSCSLGKKTWILLSHVADWRWLLNRDDSPWYPSAKLYRQDRIYHWESVLTKLKADLLAFTPL
jgi:tetratricopeptide (TPR) repeat protein